MKTNVTTKTIILIRLLNVAIICVMAAVLLGVIVWKKQGGGGVTRDCFAMDTYFTMKAYGKNAEDALELAELEIVRLERLFSVTREESDVWRINHAGGEAATVDTDTYALIETAVQMGDATDGALDITLYPVLAEWGFTTGTYQVPDAERIAELLEDVDYRKIRLEQGAVQLPDGMELDLGSVAKGYTGDVLTELLRENGVTSALLDLGGNVQAIGSKPDGSGWTVAVRNPFYEEDGAGSGDTDKAGSGEATDTDVANLPTNLYTIGTLTISDKCVITSGNYERCFTAEDGQTYGHILDPADGYPADNGLASVTIIGDNGVTSDALSTALYVMGTDRAIAYWQGNPTFDMILVTDGGEVWITPGIADCFEPAEGVSLKSLI